MDEQAPPQPPHRTGKPPVEIPVESLRGRLIPWQANEQPVLLGMPGSPHLYLACFSTPEKLQGMMELANIPFDKIKQVEEGYDFFTSIPRDVKIILDPYFLPNGRIRFTELMFD